MKKVMLGDRFYRNLENGEIKLIRVIKFKNENLMIARDEDTRQEEKYTRDELLNKWVRIKPVGILSLSIVKLEAKNRDVIVSVFRQKDLDKGDGIPYCVCRQSVLDVFTNQTNRNPNINYVGISVSKDTIPEDVPYEMMLACNGVEEMTMISMYLGDTLDILLGMVHNLNKYDVVLKSLYDIMKNNPSFRGYCSSLRQLLNENNFMYDMLKAFNIEPIPYGVITVNDSELYPDIRKYIEGLLKVEMFRTYVIPYDLEIDIKQIKRDYVMIMDSLEKLYIIAYDKGEYINREYRDSIKDKRDAVAMLKLRKTK